MSKIKYSNKSVTYPKGFYAASCSAHLKDETDDMALIFTKEPAQCAIVMTSNKVKAAPVIWDGEITANGSPKHAVVVNTVSANACTGQLGYVNARAESEVVGALLGVEPSEVLVSSTGVIGTQLDMDKVEAGIRRMAGELKDTKKAGMKAAEAILTTDTVTKTASAKFMIGDKKVKIGAMAKGSGMIRPNMATMLSYACTDCAIEQKVLQEALSKITEDTYNMISVDGDMSTNDTAVVLANGEAGNEVVTSLESEAGKVFYEALFKVEEALASAIVRDGEGATKYVQVHVSGAANKRDARTLARAVAESNLVKTALFGEDANWGRIVAALGAADADFDPAKAKVSIDSDAGRMDLFEKGEPVPFDEDEALKILSLPEVTIDISMGQGDDSATAHGCDLSYEYVKINGEYRS